jgi:3-hydroxyisobutyrate dehydrogenase-like beta-hydroxyacid dehydrogenase
VSETVGVVGLGHMGGTFAQNLIADGYRVVGYDRNPERIKECPGAEPAVSLGDLAQCDAIITSLSNDEALASVALGDRGLVGVMRSGTTHISMSTVSPGISRRVAQEHEAHGQRYVAAPVLGNPDLARARKLFVLAGGRPDALNAVKPLLDRLGQRVFIIGDDPGSANLMKLAGNVLTAATMATMGEVFALLRKGGVEQRLAFDVLTNSLFDSQVHRAYGGKIVEERYLPAGMVVRLAVKDMRLALAEAEQEAVPMPLASLVHDRLVGVMAHDWADLDWSALGLLAASDAGLERGPAEGR